MFSLENSLKLSPKRPIFIYKLKAPEYLSQVILSNGAEITVTNEHPLLSIEQGQLIWKKAGSLKVDDYVAVPRILPKKQTLGLDEEILEKLGKEFFVRVASYKQILDHLSRKYGTLTKAHKELKIERTFSSFVGHWKYNKIIPINLYHKLKEELPIKITALQFGGSKPIPIPVLSAELSELVGLVLAEGHLAEKVCEITNKDIKIIERFADLNYRLFGVKAKIFTDSRGLIRARIMNWTVIRLLHDTFEVPFGNKSRIITIPELILKGNEAITKSFLRSYIEAEGHIGVNNRTIEIATASKQAALGLVHLLLTLGIESTLSKKVTETGIFYRVFISGASKYEKIRRLELYTRKNDEMTRNDRLPKQFEITNLIPKCGPYIKNLRLDEEISQRYISEQVGSARSLISLYESCTTIPRQNLLQISRSLNSDHLTKLAESEISWIKIKDIKQIKSKDKWVYDLSMDNSNFIANNIISHNTTTIAKVAKMFQDNDKSVVMAAADTFRAAAIEQLQQHADKLGIKMIKHEYQSDSAAVAFDAVKHAEAQGKDIVLIDTAGRLHSNRDLLDELKKIIRVSKPDFKIFVGESITGNDCVEQAKEFDEAVGIDAIILAKADIDEKGGAALSVSYVTKKPVIYLGTGQKVDDLKEFKKEDIIKSLGL